MTRRPSEPSEKAKLTVAIVAGVGFILWLIAFVLLNSGCSLKSQQAIHVGVQAGDLLSTYHGEQHGGYEANPLAPKTWPGRIALKAAVSSAVIYATHRLEQHGQGTLARNLLAVVNTVLAGVVINNVRISR